MKKRIVILTGAGISAESGVPTFRDVSNGLWHKYKIEDVATPEAFENNPRLVQEFYNSRRRDVLKGEIKPNAAHFALAKLQKEYRGFVYLITQNIDNLHEMAGSKSVVHMHGELLKARCLECGGIQECFSDLTSSSLCVLCKSAGRLRPHVVWFGEMPLFMEEIYRELGRANVFISIGTSGKVYPAAGFVQHAKYKANAETVELNLESTDNTGLFNTSLTGRATEIVPPFVEELIKSN